MLLAGVLVALATATLLVARWTRPERLGAFLVDTARSKFGADLRFGAQARYAFLPRLHAVLPAPSLALPGSAEPFIAARSLELDLPWRNLWRGGIEVERLEIIAPVLDLDAFEAWLAARPAGAAALPELRLALRIRDAGLRRAGKTLARGVDLDLASTGDLGAWLNALGKDGATIALPPLAGQARLGEVHAGEALLEGVELQIDDGAPGKP